MVTRWKVDRDRRKRQKWTGTVSNIRRWRNGRTGYFRGGTPSRGVTRRHHHLWRTWCAVDDAARRAPERGTRGASANPVKRGLRPVSTHAGWESARVYARIAVVP